MPTVTKIRRGRKGGGSFRSGVIPSPTSMTYFEGSIGGRKASVMVSAADTRLTLLAFKKKAQVVGSPLVFW